MGAILDRACQASDAGARACLAYLMDNIHRESGLTSHLEPLTGACVKHDPAAFKLPNSPSLHALRLGA